MRTECPPHEKVIGRLFASRMAGSYGLTSSPFFLIFFSNSHRPSLSRVGRARDADACGRVHSMMVRLGHEPLGPQGGRYGYGKLARRPFNVHDRTTRATSQTCGAGVGRCLDFYAATHAIKARSHPRSLPAFDLEESDGGDCLDPDGPGIRRR